MVRGETLTVVQLKAQAKSKGIKGYSTMKKAELIKVLGVSTSPKSSPKKGSRGKPKRTSLGKPSRPTPKPISFKWQLLMPDGLVDLKGHKNDMGFVDFRKETSSYIENRWKVFQKDSNERIFELPISKGTPGGQVNFREFTLKWVMKTPVGEITFVSRLRRKLNQN